MNGQQEILPLLLSAVCLVLALLVLWCVSLVKLGEAVKKWFDEYTKPAAKRSNSNKRTKL